MGDDSSSVVIIFIVDSCGTPLEDVSDVVLSVVTVCIVDCCGIKSGNLDEDVL